MGAFQALLLDVNGVQVDTAWHLKQSNVLAFRHFGYELTDAIYERHFINQSTYSGGAIEENRWIIDHVEFRRERWKILRVLVHEHGVQQIPGVESLISEIRALRPDMQIASVSNNAQREVTLFHKAARLSGMFDLIVTNEMVARQKPYPDPYLKAIKELNVEAPYCLVIENTSYGITAAREAGIIKVIAVASNHQVDVNDPELTKVQTLKTVNTSFIASLEERLDNNLSD